MRFSLATLVLLVLWIGAGMWVWAWRTPWSYSYSESRAEFEKGVPERWFGSCSYAPDGLRSLALQITTTDVVRKLLIERHSGRKLFEFPCKGNPCGFLDDNNCAFRTGTWNLEISPDDQYEVYSRHFPEWWWGHFYRPEVWLALGLSAALGWRAVRARKIKTGREAPRSTRD